MPVALPTARRQGKQTATVAAAFRGWGWGGAEQRITVRYDMTLECSRWFIDDVRGSIHGKEWSLRTLLLAHQG